MTNTTALKPFTVAEIALMETLADGRPVLRKLMSAEERTAAASLVKRGLLIAGTSDDGGLRQFYYDNKSARMYAGEQYDAWQDARWALYHPADTAAYIAPVAAPQVADVPAASDLTPEQQEFAAKLEARKAARLAAPKKSRTARPTMAELARARFDRELAANPTAILLNPDARRGRQFEAYIDGRLVGSGDSYLAAEQARDEYLYLGLTHAHADSPADAASLTAEEVVAVAAVLLADQSAAAEVLVVNGLAEAHVIPAEAPYDCLECGDRGYWADHDEGGAFDGYEFCEACPVALEAIDDARRLVAASRSHAALRCCELEGQSDADKLPSLLLEEMALREVLDDTGYRLRIEDAADVAALAAYVRAPLAIGDDGYCWPCGVWGACQHSPEAAASVAEEAELAAAAEAERVAIWGETATARGSAAPPPAGDDGPACSDCMPNPAGVCVCYIGEELFADELAALPFTPGQHEADEARAFLAELEARDYADAPADCVGERTVTMIATLKAALDTWIIEAAGCRASADSIPAFARMMAAFVRHAEAAHLPGERIVIDDGRRLAA